MKTLINKRITGLFAMFIMACTWAGAQDDAITKYFSTYLEDNRFSVVYISPAMFDFFTDLEEGKEKDEMTDVIKDLQGMRILTSDNAGKAFYKEALNKIPMEEYELLMEVRENDGSQVKFFTKKKGEQISELLVLVGGEGQDFVLMSFVGNLDLKKISKLSKDLNVKGAEHLDKMKDAK